MSTNTVSNGSTRPRSTWKRYPTGPAPTFGSSPPWAAVRSPPRLTS